MRISLIAGLNNESPVDTCIRDLTRARDEGFARIWMTQMPYDTDRCGEHVGPTLRTAAAEAGRAEGSVNVAAALPVSVTEDVDAARAVAAQQFAMYGYLPSYRAMLDREGYARPEDAALIGDEETVWARLDQVHDAGVDEFVAIPFDPSPKGRERTRNCVRAWESRASSA